MITLVEPAPGSEWLSSEDLEKAIYRFLPSLTEVAVRARREAEESGITPGEVLKELLPGDWSMHYDDDGHVVVIMPVVISGRSARVKITIVKWR